MGFDTSQINDAINGFVEKIKEYFQSLTQYETYAWVAFVLGLVLVIVSIII